MLNLSILDDKEQMKVPSEMTGTKLYTKGCVSTTIHKHVNMDYSCIQS